MEPILKDSTYKKITDFLYKNTGIELKEYKKYLVINRLSKYIGPDKIFKDYEDFYENLINDSTGEVFTILTNSLTTNFSYFFREPEHFRFLYDILKERYKSESYIRLWSAASSTGEEGYSMALTSYYAIPNIEKYDFRILGTDISDKVLKVAKEGIYKKEKIEGHIPQRLHIHFTKKNEYWIINQEIKNLIRFAHLNLFDDYPFKRKFDVVFLRNVMIYFDNNKKQEILDKIYEFIKPQGYLIIGLSESLVTIKHKFKHLKNSIYQKEE